MILPYKYKFREHPYIIKNKRTDEYYYYITTIDHHLLIDINNNYTYSTTLNLDEYDIIFKFDFDVFLIYINNNDTKYVDANDNILFIDNNIDLGEIDRKYFIEYGKNIYLNKIKIEKINDILK
jgi:hypothetical protein